MGGTFLPAIDPLVRESLRPPNGRTQTLRGLLHHPGTVFHAALLSGRRRSSTGSTWWRRPRRTCGRVASWPGRSSTSILIISYYHYHYHLLLSLSLFIIVIIIIKPALQVKYQHAEQDGKVEERPQISNTSTPMAALSRLRHRLEVVVSQVKKTSRELYCGCAGAKGRRTDGCADLKELVSHEHCCAHRQTGSSGSDNTTLNHKKVT